MPQKNSDSENSDSMKDEQIYRDPMDRNPIGRRQKSKRMANSEKKYQQDLSEEEEMETPSEKEDYIFFKGGRISKVLGERKREGTNETEKYCKFQSKSYLHLEWLTDNEMEARNIQPPRHTKRHRTNIQNQIESVRQKFGDQHYFNPAYLKVDRILTTSVLFPIMHHKKGSEMNGKWSQSLMLVCSKMLNFEQQNIPYGVIQKDEFEKIQIEEFKLSDPVKLEHVINRVFLDFYKKTDNFWIDVGKSMNNLVKVYQGSGHQFHCEILKECIIFLYWQWYALSRQKFLKILPKKFQEFATKMKEENAQVSFKVQKSPNIDFNKYIQKNFFIRQEDNTISQKQLFLLYPGKFSYSWLLTEQQLSDSSTMDYKKFQFKNLSEKDFDKMSLNEEAQPIYLVKWCDLDYDEVTWEKQGDLNCIEKINNFKQYTKIPGKKDREKMEENKKYHKALLNYGRKDKKSHETAENIERYRRKFYHLSKTEKEIKQFGGDDIPIYKGYKILKNFQLQGLNWLIKAWCERRNCILADEMGLGKTIQTIAYLNHLFLFEGVIGPFLVIAPVSTLKQWRNQIELWSDMNCVLYKGTRKSRDLIEQYEFYHKFVTNQGQFVRFQKLPRFQIMLTNYQIMVSDYEVFSKIPFQHIIVDEAHRMKNNQGKLSKVLRELPCPRILLLTGTPIQNNVSELWGLLNFIQPRNFPSQSEFKERYGRLSTVEDLNSLKEALKPYMMRRVKSDVEKSIPKLSEMLVTLDLTMIQKAFYRAVLQKNKQNLLGSLNSVAITKVSICLRQICNHPFMLSDEVEEQILSGCSNEVQKVQKFISSSSKMIFVHKFLTKCKNNGSKTLIFTQFLDMMRLLKQYCESHSIAFETLDGSVNYEERQNRIDRFNNQPNVLVFIISTKAGGVGINLTSATNIIIYDSDWNPQNDIQAIARAHRIGQKNNVSVYRLITIQTYEDIIYKSAVKKLGVGMAILDDDYFTNNQSKSKNSKSSSSKSKEELQKLLRDGVLGFLKNQGGEKQKKDEAPSLQNFSIDEILQKNCQAIDYQTKQCTFTKTKFQVDEEEDLNLDDPNFWEVALKDIESPLQKMVKKVKDAEEYKKICESIPEQMKLMHEANEIVYNFVKSKITMTHFNAQDQRQLKSFLDKISYERQFHKKYKDIVNEWLEEIQKPSRRFNKIDSEVITSIADKKMPNDLRITRKAKKDQPPTGGKQKNRSPASLSENQIQSEMVEESLEKNRGKKKLKKLKRVAKSNESSQSGDSNSSDSDDSNEEQNNESSSKKSKNIEKSKQKQIHKKKQKNEKKNHNGSQVVEQISDNLSSYINSFCSYCERNRCSLMCQGDCNKMFHKLCYQKYKNNEKEIPEKNELEEENYDDESFIQKFTENFECFECILETNKCFLCNQSGEIVPSEWVKGAPKKPDKGDDHSNERNLIQKILQNATQEEKSKIFQCRMGYCKKFYHLACLKEIKDKLPFEIYLNREGLSFPLKCPCHFCTECQQSLTISKASCLRCPASLHTKCKIVKRDSILELSNENFICLSHLTEQEIEKKKKECNFIRGKSTKHEKMHQKRINKAKQEIKIAELISKSGQMREKEKVVSNKINEVVKKLHDRHNGRQKEEQGEK